MKLTVLVTCRGTQEPSGSAVMDKMTRIFLRAPLGLNKVGILDPWRWAAEPNLRLLNSLIWIRAAGFIAILALSAAWDPTIALLHLFQSLMYVAVIALSAKGSRWGLFLGVSAAAFWNYATMFGNTFFH